MPRYFFDVHDGEQATLDIQGTELADDTVARDEATKTLTEIAAQEIPGDGDHRNFRMVVRDGLDSPIFEIRIEFHSHSTRAEN